MLTFLFDEGLVYLLGVYLLPGVVSDLVFLKSDFVLIGSIGY